MTKTTFAAVSAALIFGAVCLADQADNRTKLTGTWQLENGAGPGQEVWVIEEKPGSIRLSHATAEQKPMEVECNTMGRECKFKESGKKTTVSMWFSGPKLVQLETRGADVVKRRFAVADSGNALEVEVIPVVPPGKAEIIRFKRSPVTAAQK